MRKVIVIGARGMVGRAVMKSLRSVPKLQLVTAGRRPAEDGLHLDLNRPETYAALQDADAIINCADNFQASPLSLMEYCLDRGLVLLECTADPKTIELALQRFQDDQAQTRGTLLLGAGLFPGLSNILAHDLMQRLARPQELQLSIFISPLSQAGPGTCRLMAEHFAYRAPVFKGDQRLDFPSLVLGPEIKSRAGSFRGLRLFFPEAIMLKAKEGMRLETFLIPMPRSLVPILAFMRPFAALPALSPVNAFFLRILRSIVLRKRTSHIRIHGRASDAEGAVTEFLLETHDGLHGIASCVRLMLEQLLHQPGRRGLLLPEDLMPSWEAIRENYEKLVPEDRVRFWGP